jgi:UTP--glucose-1-phosphate uridylyltransferase
MKKIRKAVIPGAGYGSRMLPITKTVSKAMLPLVDKPIIQVVVEELVEAGIEDIIIVVSSRQADLVDYFGDIDTGLAGYLQSGDASKQAMLQSLEDIKSLANFIYVDQRDAVYGTGNPVLCSVPYLDGEPFIYTFADDFFVAKHKNSYIQLLEAYEHYGTPVVGCQIRTADEDYDRYGYIGGIELQSGEVDIKTIVEHPGKANKPGDLASLGGFIVTPEVLPYLKKARVALPKGKEFFFNTALGLMVADGKKVVAKEIVDAKYYDTGNKLEYMKTITAMGATHPEIGKQFTKFLKQFVKEDLQ